MPSKKTFKDTLNPAELFISTTAETAPEQAERPARATQSHRTAPKQPETKSRRLQLLIKPSTAEKLKAKASRAGTSVNDLINSILEDALRK